MPRFSLPNHNGGSTSIEHTTSNEKTAVKQIVDALQRRIKRNTPRDKVITDFDFGSEFNLQVAQEFRDEICEIAGLESMEFFEDGGCSITPFSAEL